MEKDGEDSPPIPIRDHANLHGVSQTIQCALGTLCSDQQRQPNRPCVPCAYKIGCYDVALDHAFTRAIPNQRPESCPRSHSNISDDYDGGSLYGYQRGMRILTVGDGDFTFSLALARMLSLKPSNQIQACSKTRIVATSYESLERLQSIYPDLEATLTELGSYVDVEITVHFNVDATKLPETLNDDALTNFHRIAWNFPCTAESAGQDGQNNQMEENKSLVRKFASSCAGLLAGNGEIHVAHKTKPPYNQWKIEHSIVPSNEESQKSTTEAGLEYKGRIVLDKCCLPPYTPRKALDKKSFPCHDACIYVFGWPSNPPTTTTVPKDPDTFDATIPQEPSSSSLKEPDSFAASIVRVTEHLLCSIRTIHLAQPRNRGKSKKMTLNKRLARQMPATKHKTTKKQKKREQHTKFSKK